MPMPSMASPTLGLRTGPVINGDLWSEMLSIPLDFANSVGSRFQVMYSYQGMKGLTRVGQ